MARIPLAPPADRCEDAAHRYFDPRAAIPPDTDPGHPSKGVRRMQLGNFSVSLAVKDIAASQAFYEKLGFRVFLGDAAQHWLILKNGDHVLGLFQSMFEKNLLTFNPGWDSNAQPLQHFTDVRELQRRLREQGVALITEADENGQGPASFMLMDPDGNPILIDQHV